MWRGTKKSFLMGLFEWWRRRGKVSVPIVGVVGCGIFFALFVLFALALHGPLFTTHYSPVLLDRDGAFLGALVADDEQWRFPPETEINEKFKAALVEFEDKRFRYHWGVDPLAAARALLTNIRAGRVVSGASTLTMQTIRLSRGGRPRRLGEKLIEAFLAVRLEAACSKDRILALYANNAPFGGNVVGIGAAAWRWFGRSEEDLSWAEAAALAVLPNGPSLVHPGRNRAALKAKRDALLEKLFAKGHFDAETLVLAQSEPLPDEPLPLPRLAPHLLERLVAESGGKTNGKLMRTSIDKALQERANAVMRRFALNFAEKGINNAAALVLDTKSGEVLAYIGNVGKGAEGAGSEIDIVTAPRSSGSVLKPFLYAALLDVGGITPAMLISDIPTRVGSYNPQNISGGYLGAVPAAQALARSLNVPAVRELRSYGVEPFARLLRSLGVTTLFRRNEDYGLPLILGGAEVTLWEMAALYAGLTRTAMNSGTEKSLFFPANVTEVTKVAEVAEVEATRHSERPPAPREISAGAAYLTLEALTFVVRPGEEAAWQEYAGARRISWKTGTSFGNRDAWAIGTTADFTIAVWVGNATGEGRPELRSAETSAPLLFELFSALGSGRGEAGWIARPSAELRKIEICAASGYGAGASCAVIIEESVPSGAAPPSVCPYCRTITLDAKGARQVTLDRGSAGEVQNVSWFVLPSAEEWYYRKWNLDYKPLPPFADEDDGEAEGEAATQTPGTARDLPLAIFNPENGAQIYVPIELDGTAGRIIFQAAHRDSRAELHWHLDDTYLGTTKIFHQMSARPPPGTHTLTLIDSAGNRVSRRFEILGRRQ
jgi:penicillin-binding protein 1C